MLSTANRFLGYKLRRRMERAKMMKMVVTLRLPSRRNWLVCHSQSPRQSRPLQRLGLALTVSFS
ncbi:unnamed protein product [Fusarium graminearum]|nr:unnamed protein product [Fusarium graminearum]